MFLGNPLIGVGLGNANFREIYGLYMLSGFDALSCYCVFLEIAVESGIFALITYLLFIGTLLSSGVKKFINSNDIQYSYNINLNIYETDTTDGVKRVNPSTVIDNINTVEMSNLSGMMTGTNVWQELFSNEELLHKQYDLVAGKWPKEYNEVVIIADKDGNVSDYALYSIGVKDQKTIKERWNKILNGEKYYNQIKDMLDMTM